MYASNTLSRYVPGLVSGFLSKHSQQVSHLLKDIPLQCAPRGDSHRIPLLTLTPATTALGHTHYVVRLPPHTRFTDFCTQQALHQGFKCTLPD